MLKECFYRFGWGLFFSVGIVLANPDVQNEDPQDLKSPYSYGDIIRGGVNTRGPEFPLQPNSVELVLFHIFAEFLDRNNPSGWGRHTDWPLTLKSMAVVIVTSLEFIKSQVIRKANKTDMQKEIQALRDEIDILKQNLAKLEAALAQSKDFRKMIERGASKRSGAK